ncbi:outer mitochondrial transmembrane helix translocase-like isoform X2 [Sceloporus undulatus]|uniref:outer mitochondrial transmembrane helix translocase-like isoform X2 n=1 Tax=Sceloporus undulatus TaxID=8520 RepID=UPI001C4BE4F1|nr:outer mitochondrial transmembrane helix translocase-like isoform X2 [Sceloporus undulatus]
MGRISPRLLLPRGSFCQRSHKEGRKEGRKEGKAGKKSSSPSDLGARNTEAMWLGELSKDLLIRPLTRNEAFAVLLRLTIFGAATYFSIKWVSDALDPTRKQRIQLKKKAERLMKQIGVEKLKLTEHEMTIATHLVVPRDIKVSWKDIAGLDETVNDLQDTVILPFQKRHLFRHSMLCQPPRGVLLYGPPGCGKTLLAKATAQASGCRFINLQASTLTDKWYGESQKLTAAVFSLATKIQPCIIFIDEIDAFLRNRSEADHEATAMMKAEFMSLWDGLETGPSCQVMVLGATNRPQDVDPAILRRMPTTFQIGLPTQRQRQDILKLILAGENEGDRRIWFAGTVPGGLVLLGADARQQSTGKERWKQADHQPLSSLKCRAIDEQCCELERAG